MAILLLATSVGMSGKNILDFQRILQEQLFQRSVGLVESALSLFESQVENWQSDVNQTLRFVAATDAKLLKENVKSVIETNPDYLSLHVIRKDETGKISTLAYAFSAQINPEDYFGVDPAVVKELLAKDEIKWVNNYSATAPEFPLYLENASHVGVPLIRVIVPAITGQNSVNWGILTIWQKSVIDLLPKGLDMNAVVIDKSGRTMVSPVLEEALKRQSMRKYNIVRRAMSGSSPVGSEEVKTKSGETILGTYAWSKRLRSGVILLRNPKLAYTEIRKQVVNTSILSFIFLVTAILFSYHASRSITKSLRVVVAGTQRIANGDFRTRLPVAKDELGLLSQAVNYMSERIANLLHVQVEAARQEKELETAKTVQETLLPKADRQVGPFSVTGTYIPASECGGDWWGTFTTARGAEFIGIADATGHGAAAALVTAMAFSSCMALAKFQSSEGGDGDSPGKILARLNEIMWNAGQGKITMTFFAAFIDANTGVMTFANAGHNFPMIIPEKADDPRLAKARKSKTNTRAINLSLGGTPLGLMDGGVFQERKVQLSPGDRIFLYTDGLIECTNPRNEMWGKNNLSAVIAESNGESIQGLRDRTVGEATKFFAGNPAKDDVTVVVVEMSKDWQPSSVHEVA